METLYPLYFTSAYNTTWHSPIEINNGWFCECRTVKSSLFSAKPLFVSTLDVNWTKKYRNCNQTFYVKKVYLQIVKLCSGGSQYKNVVLPLYEFPLISMLWIPSPEKYGLYIETGLRPPCVMSCITVIALYFPYVCMSLSIMYIRASVQRCYMYICSVSHTLPGACQ